MKLNWPQICNSVCFALVLLLASCSSSEKAHSSGNIEINSGDDDVHVIVEKLPAIVGGREALQQKLVYPKAAKENGIEAVLKAKVSVSKTGNIENIAFDTDYGYGFKEAATNALHQVEFKPGMRNGKPIRMVTTIPVSFEL
jgi:TonB family protein